MFSKSESEFFQLITEEVNSLGLQDLIIVQVGQSLKIRSLNVHDSYFHLLVVKQECICPLGFRLRKCSHNVPVILLCNNYAPLDKSMHLPTMVLLYVVPHLKQQ